MSTAVQLLINIAVPATLYALVAAGFSVIYSVTRAQNIAHGAVAIASGYVFFALWQISGWHPAVAASFTLIVGVGLGMAMNTFVFELMRRRKRGPATWAETLIASFALLIFIQNALLAVFGPQPKIFHDYPVRIFDIGGAAVTSHQLLALSVGLALLLALALFLKTTKLGKAMRAAADNESMAEVVGINTSRVREAAVILASALAAAAGMLFALEYNLDPSMPTIIAVKMYFRAIIGGIGSVPGAVLGSFVNESAEQLGGFFWKTAYKDFIAVALTFAVLLWKPKGLFGFKERT